MGYLNEFHAQLHKQLRGSLVSVREAQQIRPHAKEYLAQAARAGMLERVTWGWYWLPAPYENALDFLTKERHFKVLHKQTAAGFWNGDFLHHDHYTVAVNNTSYARALGAFARSRGWNITIESRRFHRKDYVKIGEAYVQSLEETIVSCLKEWAFADAFAALYEHQEDVLWRKLSLHAWERIPHTNTRIGQVITYGTSTMSNEHTRAVITDGFVKRQIDEAIQKVVELG